MQKDIEVLKKLIEIHELRGELNGISFKKTINGLQKAIKCMELLSELVNMPNNYSVYCQCQGCDNYNEKLKQAKELLGDGYVECVKN